MSKTMLGTYPFNASAKTVDLSSIPDYTFQQLRLIYNLTVRLPIYVNTSSTFTGSMDGGSLVFDASNAGMQNTDELEIIYDDQSAQPVSVTNPPADYPSTETVAAIAETNTAIANLQTVLSEFSANLAEVTKNVAVTLNGRATTGTGAVVSTDGSTVTWPLTGALLNAVQMSNTLITPDQGPVFIAVSWPAGTEPEYGEFQSVLAGFVAAYYDPDQVVSNGLSGGALPLATAQGTVAISLPHSVEFNNGSGSTYAADYDFGPEWVVFIGYNPVNGQVFIRSVKGSHITNAGPFNTGLTGLPVQAFIGVSMSSSTPANAGLQLLSNAGLAAIAASWGDYYYAWPGYTNVADPDFQLLTYDYETHDALESIETALTTAVSKLSTIATNLPAKGSANSAASMPVTIATDDAQWGTDGTGITQPTGGSGARGWWSGIYSQALAIVASLGGDGAGESPANGTGVRGWLRSIYDRLTAGIGLNAGTNIIGKVGIDQTTPGTTNGVVVNNSALPAGAATDTSVQAITTSLGTKADSAASTDTGTFSLIALTKRLLTKIPVLGAAATASSMPTTVATDDAQWGTDGTGITQPAGGSGARGWWSGIYSQALAIVASLGGDGAGESPANGTGVRGWLRSIYDRLTAGIGLNAGTNIIGKVGIDQTTPGTTNGVVVNNSALPAGAATDTSVQAITTSLGTKADSAASTDTGTFSLIALTKRLLTKIPVLGAAATASSMPTTVATDDAQWGTDGTGITQPAGGTGIRGWLSGIFNLQNSTVSGGRVQTRALTAATDTVTIVASDTTPSTQTITAADAATTSATGQGSQIIYTGTPTANSVAQFTLAGQQTVGLQLTGVVAGNLYQVEVSIDGTNWYLRTLTLSAITWANISANCLGSVNVAGMKYLRVRCTTYVSGTATVALTESLNESNITVSAPADIVYPTASITATGFYLFPVPQGYQSAQFSIYGTFSATMTFVGTVDSAGVTAFSAGAILTNAVSSTGGTSSTTGAGNFELAIPVGSKYVGVLVTAYASGTVSLSVSLSTRAARVYSTGSSVSVTSATGGILGLTGTASDGMSISTSALNVAQQMSYNGSNYDRLRNNTSGTITASGAITSSAGSTAQTNYNAKGVIVTLNITAYSGTSPTITLQLQTQDAAGNWVNIPGAATATISAANGSYVLVLYPGIAAYSTSPGWAVSGALPRNWRVYSTIGGSGSPSITCSLGYNYIL